MTPEQLQYLGIGMIIGGCIVLAVLGLLFRPKKEDDLVMLCQIGDRIMACPHFPEGTRVVCQACKYGLRDEPMTVTQIDEAMGIVHFDTAGPTIPVPPNHLADDEPISKSKPQCDMGVCRFCDALRYIEMRR